MAGRNPGDSQSDDLERRDPLHAGRSGYRCGRIALNLGLQAVAKTPSQGAAISSLDCRRISRARRLLSGLPFHCTDGQLITSPQGENTLQPGHQREHDVDHQALVEEVDRPKRRFSMPGIRDNASKSRIRRRPRARPQRARPIRSIRVGLRPSRRRRTVCDRERRELFAPFQSWKGQATVSLNHHRELLARCGSSFHIRAYQISHAPKSKLNTHPDIKNTGIHLADENSLGMF